jgi:membrane fusion protein (multidrug efflux system)
MTTIDRPEVPAASTVVPGRKAGYAIRGRQIALALLGGAALIAIGLYGFHWLTVGRYLESTNDAYLRADAMIVAPRISGYISEVPVVANQDVLPDQVLVRIEASTYQAQLARAKAQQDAGEADIRQLRAQISRQQAILDQAKAQADIAETAEAYASRESGRYGQLEHSGAVSAQQADQARTLLSQRRADLDNAKAAIVSAGKQIEVLEAEIGQSESALEAAKAAVMSAQLDLDATVLRSRIKGRVGDKTVTIGQYVQAGTRLMSVMPLQDVYLEANFKETQIGRMRAGQPVKIQVDALPGTAVTGIVESLAPGTGSQFALMPPENATGNFTKIVQRVPVRIRIEADQEIRAALLPGLSVTAIVDTRKAKEADNGGH